MSEKRDPFNFYVVRMSSIISNTTSIFFYSTIMSIFLRIAGSVLLLKDFLTVAKSLLDRVINQGSSKQMILKQIKKAFNRHPEPFQKYHTMASYTVSRIAATYINERSVSDTREVEQSNSVFGK